MLGLFRRVSQKINIEPPLASSSNIETTELKTKNGRIESEHYLAMDTECWLFFRSTLFGIVFLLLEANGGSIIIYRRKTFAKINIEPPLAWVADPGAGLPVLQPGFMTTRENDLVLYYMVQHGA